MLFSYRLVAGKEKQVRKMRSKISSNPLPEYIPSIYSAFYCTRHFGKNAELRIFSVSCADPNVSRKGSLFSINLGRKRAMFSSQNVYVFEPLHLRDIFTPIWSGPFVTNQKSQN